MNPLNHWLEKKLKIRYVLLLIIMMLFIVVLLASLVRHQYLKPFNSKIGRTIEQIAELPSNIKNSILKIGILSLQIIPNRFKDSHKYTFNQSSSDSGYLLQSRYDKIKRTSIIELIFYKKTK